MKITLKQLELKGACDLDQFKKLFGNQVEITEENCFLALNAHMNLDWVVERFFTAPAWEAYDKATAPAWEAYVKATAPALEAYEKAKAPAWEAYRKAKASAFYKASLIMSKKKKK